MTTHPRRWVTALCTAAMAVPLAGAAVASAAPAAPAAHRHPSRVQLPTGERLAVRWVGDTPRVSRLPGDRSPIAVVTSAGRVYAVPAEARPFLGGAVDLSLFDVAALADRGGPVPVSLAFAGTARAVPGVRATSGTAGEVTSPAAFGAALRAAVRRGPADARSAGTPVPGLTRVALAAPAARTVRPNFPMRTLTVRLVLPAGRTVLGAAVLVTNTDDTRTYSRYTPVGTTNEIRISVPDGHYNLVGDVAVADADGNFAASYVPVVVDYAVTGPGQAVTVDANKATAHAGFTTPEPSDLVSVGLDIGSVDGTHESPGGISYAYATEDQVLVQPTARPAHGVLELDTYEHRSGPPADGADVDWHLTAEWLTGVPADLRRAPTAAEFATVTDTVPADGPSQLAYARGPVYPDLRGAEETSPTTTATRHVDHLYGPPDVRWAATVYRSTDAGVGDGMSSASVAYPPGAHRVDWFAPSLAAGFAGWAPFPRPYSVACRTADRMHLTASSEMDADPDHDGWVSPGDTTGYSRLMVSADGTQVADVADTDAVAVPVSADAHTYRIEQTVRRGALGFPTATTVNSVYTVPSSATSGAALPDGWYCPDATGAATVLPLLTVTAPLPATVPVGTTEFTVTVGHVAAAAPSAVTGLTAATSLDGTTYVPARVTGLGAGRYRVALDVPSAGHRVSLRLTATDAAGSALTRTVTDATTTA
ncbi:MAG TPA: hypothetical protein VGN37_31815 [Actinocatenispora sp.]